MLPCLLTDTVTTDLNRAVDLTLLWGLEAMELRTVGGAEERVPRVNERAIQERLMIDEVPVAAVSPSMFEGRAGDRAVWLNELAGFEETLRFCQRLRCPRVVISAFVDVEAVEHEAVADVFRRAGKAAEAAGLRLAVLNEAGMAHQTGVELAGLLEAVDHPAVRAGWSPAEALQAGEWPDEGLAALEGRIELVRCSDGMLREGTWQDRMLGEGEVGWPELLRQLAERGFNGPVSMEVYLEPRRKMGLRMATRLVEWLRSM